MNTKNIPNGWFEYTDGTYSVENTTPCVHESNEPEDSGANTTERSNGASAQGDSAKARQPRQAFSSGNYG
jgi:hypothetical protein